MLLQVCMQQNGQKQKQKNDNTEVTASFDCQYLLYPVVWKPPIKNVMTVSFICKKKNQF